MWFAGVHSEVCAECSVEPVCSLYREQSGHLRCGRCSGLSSGNAHPLQSHQHTRHHREWRRHPAKCFQPYRHQRGAQVNTYRLVTRSTRYLNLKLLLQPHNGCILEYAVMLFVMYLQRNGKNNIKRIIKVLKIKGKLDILSSSFTL